ncbi:MAG: tetratricopeptide repeat protein [Planctomycetota bacterium]|jgi:hypothetical protein
MPPRAHLSSRLLIIACAFGLTGAVVAQETQPGAEGDGGPRSAAAFDEPRMSGTGGAIPVRVIDGRLVISCDISGVARRLPVNLWLDYDGAYGLQVHNRAAAPLPAETGDGQALPLTLHFPDFTVQVPRRELGDEEAFEHFTKYHSSEIGENALVGAIGAHCLKAFSIVFDLPRNRIELRPAGSMSGQQPGMDGEQVIVPITVHNDQVWMPVTLADDSSRALAIGSSRFDSLVDLALCDRFGKPAGDIGQVACRTIDFAKYVALRPEDVILVHPDGVAGILGINALQSMRIEVDRETGLASIEPQRAPSFPQADLQFFAARATEEAAAVEAWLEANPNGRLGREASELLLTYRLEEGATEEELAAAVKRIHDTMLANLRATRMLDLMEELANEGEIDLLVVAGELGIESGRKDRYPDAVHKVHGRLGEVLLERDEDREAWRHLLAAAFGLPEDGLVNLNLGRCYEKSGRFRRAFSRYIQAVIKEESGPQAMEGLQRIDPQMPAEDRLSWEVVERMIAGKVRNYGAPMKYEPPRDAIPTGRTVLVEFFTNAYVGDERGGAIGGALGNQGLLTHFEPEHCVFLSYHLPTPQLDPMVNAVAESAAAVLRVDDPAVQVIDGVTRVPGAARWRDAEAVYAAGRDAVISRIGEYPGYEIVGSVRRDGDRLTGQVTVAGPTLGPNMRLQVIVAEQGVVFPGKSTVVIHRVVARGTALGGADGVPCAPDDGELTFAIDRDIASVIAENEAHLASLEASGAGTAPRMGASIDPSAVVLIAVVRDLDTGEVYQAAQIVPEAGDDGA